MNALLRENIQRSVGGEGRILGHTCRAHVGTWGIGLGAEERADVPSRKKRGNRDDRVRLFAHVRDCYAIRTHVWGPSESVSGSSLLVVGKSKTDS